jgi:two-component system sensor histidine kinase/response regulator
MSISTENNPLKRMLTVDEVAYTLHVHPVTVRKWAKSGQLKSYHLGAKGNIRFKVEDVSSFSDLTGSPPVINSLPIPETKVGLSPSVPTGKTESKPSELPKTVTAFSSDTIKKPIKESILVSEKKFASIFLHSPVAFSLTRMRDNVFIEINDSYTHFSGYTRNEIIGRNVSEMNLWVNPEDRVRMFKILEVKDRVVNEEYYVRGKAGEVHHVLLSAEKINIGGEECLLVMILDISKRKKAEEALKESEKKFRNLFENAKDAVILAETDTGILVDINTAGCNMLCLPKAQVVGKHITILHPPEMAEKFTRVFRDHVKKGIVDSDDTIIQCADGRQIPAIVSANVVWIGEKEYIQGIFHDISMRKQTEETLRFSDAAFKSIQESIIAINNDNIVTYWNEISEELFGIKASEAIGKNLFNIIRLKESPSGHARELSQKLMKQGYNRDEMLFQTPRGEVWTDMTAKVMEKDNQRYGYIITALDITERKKAEQALKNSEEKFSKVFSTNANAIGITSLNTNLYIEANESFSRFTGYPHEEIIGRSAAELNLWIKPEELKQWKATLEVDGHVSNMEFSSRMKTGQIRIGLASAEVINIGDEPCRIISITDITERKKSEEALRFSDAAFKSIHEAVIAIDNDNIVTYWNSISEELFGVKASETIGRKFSNLIQPVETYPGHNEELLRKLKNQGFNRDELLYNTPNNKVWVDMTVRAIEKDGKQYGYVMTASDISERKQMEHELSNYRSQLEELVEKRTAELSTVNKKLEEELEERKRIGKELVQARDAAEGANRTKSDFLARMSHEIRTPIHGVIGTLNLLLDTPLKEEQRQFSNMARASAESLLGIINDILDFSKIEAAQLVLEEMDFDLQATVEEALQPMALLAHKKGLELTCRIPYDIPPVLVGDAGRLRQTLVNLLGNAVKFTERGEVYASIEIESESDDNIELHFTVRDTGIGIAPEKQNILFNPFTQTNGSKYGGTGLGLAICRQLVKMMQGRIWLESQSAQGSTFHFIVKFKKSASSVILKSIPPDFDRFKGTLALIIDDNPSTRLVLSELLNNWGLIVTSAENEAEAKQQLQRIKDTSNRLPIVLLDMTMAPSNGFTIARNIINDPLLKRNIIMMLPCDNISYDFARCQEAGIPLHLVKPIKKRELQNAVLASLGANIEKKEEQTKVTASAIPSLRLRILVAEDNPTSQLIARKTLEKMGCTVQIAGNGLEATRMIQQGNFDLVLMDFEMPEMNGLEATRVIRNGEKETRQHLPIIAMTANAMKKDHDCCLEAGMDGYLTKPVSPENLYNAIKGLLPSTKLNQEPEQKPSTIAKPGQEPAVDLEAAFRTVGDDKEILIEVLKVFQEEDSPRLIKSIQEALQRQDGKTIKAEAHGMKGAVAALGGKTVAAAAARLEAAGLSGDMTTAQSLFNEMCTELERFKEFYSKANLDTKGGDR